VRCEEGEAKRTAPLRGTSGEWRNRQGLLGCFLRTLFACPVEREEGEVFVDVCLLPDDKDGVRLSVGLLLMESSLHGVSDLHLFFFL
jgi:hypothetical protein